jgi:hypothetical protein
VGIGTGIAAAGLCTLAMVGAMRKFKEAPEEELLKQESQEEAVNDEVEAPQEEIPREEPE